jgi:hypothetical protein
MKNRLNSRKQVFTNLLFLSLSFEEKSVVELVLCFPHILTAHVLGAGHPVHVGGGAAVAVGVLGPPAGGGDTVGGWC